MVVMMVATAVGVGAAVTVGVAVADAGLVISTEPPLVLPVGSLPAGSPMVTAGALEKAMVAVIGVQSTVTSASVSGTVAMGGE